MKVIISQNNNYNKLLNCIETGFEKLSDYNIKCQDPENATSKNKSELFTCEGEKDREVMQVLKI